eukprot:gene2641-2942_t
MSGLDASSSAVSTIRVCQGQLQERLYPTVHAEQQKRLRRWQDEAPMLETYITALKATKDIIQREQKQVASDITNLKAFLDKQAAEAAKQAPADAALAGSGIAELQSQHSEMQAKLADLDRELAELGQLLSSQSCRPEEQSIYETKLVVLQDTRRLLQVEASSLAAELKRRQAAARLSGDRQAASELGLSDLSRLSEQLAVTESRLDRAKLDYHFPQQQGFRFSGGGGGIYCGVKDLHLCEVSGAFSLSLEGVDAPEGASSRQRPQRQARLKGDSPRGDLAHQLREGGAEALAGVRAGFSRLAEAFNEKATAFGDRDRDERLMAVDGGLSNGYGGQAMLPQGRGLQGVPAVVPMHPGTDDKQDWLGGRLEGMKGKLGGFINESKQKLQDSAKGSGGRRGVVVMLLAEGLEVIGEKGTKVPNIRAAHLGLEVEAAMSATFTYSTVLGWQSDGLSFEVLSLERVVQGSNLPLPKTLIKSVLNMVMPSFRHAGGRLMLSADKDSFSVAVENANYEGPLRVDVRTEGT